MMTINDFGFLRVAAASPRLKVADCDYNITEIKSMITQAVRESVQIIVFPELSITGYTCGDLFFQEMLQRKAVSALTELSRFMKEQPGLIAIVGLPLRMGNRLLDVAAVLSQAGILGMVPKTAVSAYGRELQERAFSVASELTESVVDIDGKPFPISGEGMLFATPFGTFGVEIGEDGMMPVSPASSLIAGGADMIFHLAAESERVGSHRFRRSRIIGQSAAAHVARVSAYAGCGESATDAVFSGACYIAENGRLLAEGERFSLGSEWIIADLDIAALQHDRLLHRREMQMSGITMIDAFIPPVKVEKMYRQIAAHPFIPTVEEAEENLSDLFSIQVRGLAKRLSHIGIGKVTIGISGGLDSTLALLVTAKCFDLLKIPRAQIYGITMPGFGTTERTHFNALELMKSMGVTSLEIPIRDAVEQHFRDIGHDRDDHGVTYENSQARERTQILMDYANKIGGLTVGTGNLSELALGWATYNGDQMSMYGVNAGVPKTLVKTLVRWIADTQVDERSRKVLNDILDTPYSPELLPADREGKIAQKTEHFVGPYELHDFFLYRMLRYGDAPRRILFLAEQAFAGSYTPEVIGDWLKVFYKRFFSQQFKRSCMPDGAGVGSVNLSPRGNWCMPSDAVSAVWLEELKTLEA